MTSLANKESAEQCKDLGKAALAKRDFAKAIRMFEKSMRLYPITGVPEMKARAERELADERNKQNVPKPSVRRTTSASSNDSSGSTRGHTPQQEQIARKIMRASKEGHYAVLGVSKGASDDEIKKSYRKLALKLHPDKNSAPEAETAFKAVSMAYTVLSDREKRRNYDLYGSDDPTNPASSPAGGMRRGPFHAYGGEPDISPEEVFNMFFGGPGFRVHRPGGFHRQHQQHHAQRERGGNGGEPTPGLFQLLQLAPILLLFLTTFSFPSTQPEAPFSLHQTNSYNVRRMTKSKNVRTGIEYWVKDTFGRNYAKDRYQLSSVESQVEHELYEELRYGCRQQQNQKRMFMNRARMARKKEDRETLVKRAEQMSLDSCDEYEKWFGSRRN